MSEEIVLTEPICKQYLDWITQYVNCQDAEKAAIAVGLPAEMGKKLYRRAAIRAEIDKRMAAINGTVAAIIAHKRVVTVELLDQNLGQIIKLTKKQILAAPPLAAAKVKALELGYRRVGLLIDGDFIPDNNSQTAKPEEAPRIFRGDGRTILTHEITETHKVTRQQEIPSEIPPPPKPTPPVIEGGKDPWENF